VGLADKDIIERLQRLSKNKVIPRDVLDFITAHSKSYGKAKLVLRKNRYFIETSDSTIMKELKNIKCIRDGIEDARKANLQGARSRQAISQAAMDNLTTRQIKIKQQQFGTLPVREEQRQQVQQRKSA
jgi:hypothetical protein